MMIGITGTAGAGKSFFAQIVKETIPSFSIMELNDIAAEHNLFSGTDKFGTRIVKVSALNSKVKALQKNGKDANIALVGHLLPELKTDLDMVFVVRANLEELIKRLEGRGYQFEKIKDNIIAEALDYCGVNSIHLSKDVFEIEGRAEMENAAKLLKAHIEHGKPIDIKNKPIDKMPELLSLIKGANKYKF